MEMRAAVPQQDIAMINVGMPARSRRSDSIAASGSVWHCRGHRPGVAPGRSAYRHPYDGDPPGRFAEARIGAGGTTRHCCSKARCSAMTR